MSMGNKKKNKRKGGPKKEIHMEEGEGNAKRQKGEEVEVREKDLTPMIIPEVQKEREARKQGAIEKGKDEEGGEKKPNGLGGEVFFRNKEKVLVLSSRGIVFRYRHLMEDIIGLLPHSKKESKLENLKEDRGVMLTELSDLRGCSSCVYFEMRKRKDLYMWLSKTPSGPSVKFLVSAVHTMAELKLTGNHLKGSRPLLTFSPSFNSLPHLQLLKELITQIFATPKGHRKSKPFYDHVLTFSVVDNHIWFRNYQIAVPSIGDGKLDKGALEKTTLIEVGPRFCLNTIKIFSGSFGGSTLYENPLYVSPNVRRAEQKRTKAGKYAAKVKAKTRRKQYVGEHHVEPEELANMWRE